MFYCLPTQPPISLSDNLSENYYCGYPPQTESKGVGGVDPPPLPEDLPHSSMFANERLPGPLPLKAKPSKPDSLASPVAAAAVGGSEEKPHKEIGILYLAQLRKSPYPINGCLRVNHRAARSHFKRHADIKHRGELPFSLLLFTHLRLFLSHSLCLSAEEVRTSLHELASSDSSWLRSAGWKLELFQRHLQEMVSLSPSLSVFL